MNYATKSRNVLSLCVIDFRSHVNETSTATKERMEEGMKLYLLFSLRIPLIHESTEVRAATLRTLRHLIKKSEDVQALETLNVHYLVTRCLDLELENKVERVQALKLARSAAFIDSGRHFPPALLR